MQSRPSRLGLTILLAFVSLVATQPARAANHFIYVVEVFPGYASAPNAQYVELQMFATGQNLVDGHAVQVFDAVGALVATFSFTSNVPNGADQASILLATTEAQSLFGVTADLLMTPVIAASGGKVCWEAAPDCVAWGDYSGPSTGVGPPFSPADGLPLGVSAQRRLDLAGSPTTLDAGDDTNNSANDFRSSVPQPRNNANQLGAVPGYGSTPAPPGPVSFGSVTVNTTVATSFTLQETGGRTLTISNPVLGGSHPADFEVLTGFPIDIPDGGAEQTVDVTCTPQATGPRTATLVLSTNAPAQPTVGYDLTCTGLEPPPPLMFYTVSPCRVVDTRSVGGPLVAGIPRTFTFADVCLIPADAKAVSLNIGITEATTQGNVRLYPAGTLAPSSSTINYVVGVNRANNAVIGLGVAGDMTALCGLTGSTHVVLDVMGYFK